MNKIIAIAFGELLSLVHLIFITCMFFLATENKSSILNYIPAALLTTESRAVLVIILTIIYVLFTGTICVLISISTYLREIRNILNEKL